MDHFREHFSHIYRYRQFFPALPDQRLLFTFPLLYLTAYKFPQEAPGLMGRPLADHKFIAFPDQGSHHLRYLHKFSFFRMLYGLL